MTDERIYDAQGTLIFVGARVASFDKVPAGVVSRIEPMDVDYNDDTGQPEGFGPFVHVEYEDGTDDRFEASMDDPYESSFVCDDVELERGQTPPPAVPDTRTFPPPFTLAREFGHWPEDGLEAGEWWPWVIREGARVVSVHRLEEDALAAFNELEDRPF